MNKSDLGSEIIVAEDEPQWRQKRSANNKITLFLQNLFIAAL
jgi:hypothetical protein